ncbi:alpha/beta fold hydrolase [Agromyces aureus]|uniref:alpha/beta fold hydrolase n=1 Tax=Agromyces aureus TaxID=453304 RepID=UPI00082E4BF8|nr:alpha/beta fold hydrolase [Agromyces aureus]
MHARTFRRGDRTIVIHETALVVDAGVPAGVDARGDAGGEASDPASTPPPTYVLVHGLGMAAEYWGDLGERLSASGRVLALDLPGFGESPEPTRVLTVPETADLVAELLRTDRIAHPVLVGHSMGAQVVADLAARHPELVERIVLIGPSVNPRERSRRRQTARLLQDVAIMDPIAFARGAGAMAEAGLPWVLANLRPALEHRLERVMPHVRAEVLVVRGEDDRVVPRFWAEAVASLAPHARYDEVPGRGHEVVARDTRGLAELVVAHARGGHPGRLLAPYERRIALSRSFGGGTTTRAGWVLRDYGYGIRWRLAQLVAGAPPERWRDGDPALPDIVLVPGVHEHWSFLTGLADALNRAGHRITIVHGLGMNRRPVPDTSRRLQRALARVAAPPAGRVIVAHSKGGLIAKHLLTDVVRGSGPVGASADERLDVRGAVTLASPYAGSLRARWFLDPSMRAFLPTDATIVELQRDAEVNSRIVSIFGTLDAHVTEGSALAGATNVIVPAAGHFRLTGSAAAHRAAVEGVAALAGGRLAPLAPSSTAPAEPVTP